MLYLFYSDKEETCILHKALQILALVQPPAGRALGVHPIPLHSSVIAFLMTAYLTWPEKPPSAHTELPLGVHSMVLLILTRVFLKITLGIFAPIPFHFIPEQHSTAARFPWNTREQAQVTDSPPGCSWWWICVLGRSSARHHSWNWRLVHRHHRCQWTLQHKHTAQHAAG